MTFEFFLCISSLMVLAALGAPIAYAIIIGAFVCVLSLGFI